MTNLNAQTKRRGLTVKTRKRIFIVVMLAYPVFHFLFFWIFVNFNSILLTFRRYVAFPSDRYPEVGWYFVDFENYRYIFDRFSVNQGFRQMIWNSLTYAVLNVGVMFPLSLLAAYILFKRVPASKFFRALFFLPSIIPMVVLTLAFKTSLDPIRGFVPAALKAVGIGSPMFFGNAVFSQFSIYLFMIWSGLGYNIILLSSAMARLPIEVLESGKLEGIGAPRELLQMVVPLIWPNITTMIVLGLISVFGVSLQPLMLSGGELNKTIGLEIFLQSQGENNLSYPATLGLICSLIGAPVIVGIRTLLERFFQEASY
ncbi:MAG: sugar ABC transporter permease [Clostridiales bacterium]|jgi:ABC-type sugar transport system permease subunit|nr:sugar ABC transporter permease [Clostridiales bacterium]